MSRRKKNNRLAPAPFPPSSVLDGNTGYHPETMANYAVPYPVESIRYQAGMLVWFMMNVFVLIPVLGNPFQPIYAYFLIPPLAAMNLWTLALMLMPRRLQLNYVLFRGIFGVMATLDFMIVNQKFAYGMLGLQGPWYGILSFAAYLVGFHYYAKSQIQKLKSPPDSGNPRNKSRSPKNGQTTASVISAAAGLGYLAANLSVGLATQKMVSVVLMSVYTLLIFVLFHFIMDLHRYYWIKKRTSGTFGG